MKLLESFLNLIPKSAKLLLRLPGLLRQRAQVAKKLGPRCAKEVYQAYKAFWSGDAEPEIVPMHVPGYEHPVLIRLHTSDVFVFEQIFFHEEYARLTGLERPKLIIDCGANIGCTSVYFLKHYPNATVIAVEPDAGNCDICARNLAPYGARAQVVPSGIWPREASLRVVRGEYRDGREWTFQVRECAPGEAAEIQAVSIPGLMQRAGAERIDILKIDIEGSEKMLFAEGVHGWLDQVDCLAIETHDEECHRTVMAAVQRHGFRDVTRHRETLFCFRGPVEQT